MIKKIDQEKSQPFNKKDKTIWYNQKDLREKVEKIIKNFGKPFLITKDGMLLYKDCVVIPCFRDIKTGDIDYE